ncbi:MAG: hypothetical protein JWQ99_1198 [Blastococcus sp.]|jgi:hypothetical protein|nr:hypothetical protein [Blastococcus sp.]
MTAVRPIPALHDAASLPELPGGAVDELEVAARLEASGLSDRSARSRHGAADVFALAAVLHGSRSEPRPEGRRRPTPSGLLDSLRRALLLVGGVLLAAAALDVMNLSTGLVWSVGVTGWVGGQFVSSIAWSRLGRGQGPEGLRRAASAALLVMVVAALAPALLSVSTPGAASTLLCLVWAAYASAVSLLVCADRTNAALATVLVGLVPVSVALAAGQAWSAATILISAAAAAGAVIVLAVRLLRTAGRPALPERSDWRASAPAAAQAAFLAASLLALLQTVPVESTTPLVVASVVGAAAADPAIVLLRARLRWSAARLYRLSAAARSARRAAVMAAAGTTLASALAAVTVFLVLRAGTPDWPATVVTAAAFTALATTSAALTAFGAPWRAVLAAALTAAYALPALLSATLATAVLLPVALVGAVTLLLYRVSDPRVVA